MGAEDVNIIRSRTRWGHLHYTCYAVTQEYVRSLGHESRGGCASSGVSRASIHKSELQSRFGAVPRSCAGWHVDAPIIRFAVLASMMLISPRTWSRQ